LGEQSGYFSAGTDVPAPLLEPASGAFAAGGAGAGFFSAPDPPALSPQPMLQVVVDTAAIKAMKPAN